MTASVGREVLNMSGLRVGLAALLLCGIVWPAVADRAELERQEAHALAQVKATASVGDLARLALIRERLGKYELAMGTWDTLKRIHGHEHYYCENTEAPDSSAVANFHIGRLQRKVYLDKHPPSPPSLEMRERLAEAAAEVFDEARGKREASQFIHMQVDLDGDLIDEVFVVGWYIKNQKHTQQFMALARWDGEQYKIIYKKDSRLIEASEEPGDTVYYCGYGRNGWKTIFVGEWGTGSELMYNGREVLDMGVSG